MLRFVMEVTRKYKIKNEYIRGKVKVERLGMKIRKGKLRWYGHAMRRDQVRKVMEMELLGKRKRGRPKRRFLDVVIWKLVQYDYGKSWCEGDGRWKQDAVAVEEHHTLWQPLIKGKGRKKKKINAIEFKDNFLFFYFPLLFCFTFDFFDYH